jgi:SSS family transporter
MGYFTIFSLDIGQFGIRLGNRLKISSCLALLVLLTASAYGQSTLLEWGELPPLPRAQSGHFVGLADGALLVVGGADFPVSPSQGGEGRWYGDIFVLEEGEENWQTGWFLDWPLAYGAAVTTDRGLAVLGGSDRERHYAEATLLGWEDSDIYQIALPQLPSDFAMGSAVALNGVVYVAGGQKAPDSTSALLDFWALDLNAPDLAWQELEAWPGPARIFPAMAAQDGSIYLFGGAEVFEGEDGQAKRRDLTDAYRYRPGDGWAAIEEVPEPVSATPAAPVGQAHVFVFGGEGVLAYHTITDTWATVGEATVSYIGIGAITWNGRIVIPGGGDRTGRLAATVLTAEVVSHREGFGTLNYLVVALYFGALVGVGIYFMRREKGTEDFFLGGRRIPWWAIGLSIFGTQLSAITFLSFPALAYATDWVYVWANMGIVFIAPYVVWGVLPHYRKAKLTTAYEYLETRFNLAARLYGASVFLLFQAGRMGIVLFLPALALQAATGIDVTICILVMGVLSTLYTVLGGIEAVIWTDVAQVVVLTAGVLISLAVIVFSLDGGVSELWLVASEADKFHMNNWTWDPTVAALWVCIIGNAFAVAYPYTADQTIVQRYLAAASEKDAKRAVWTNALLSIPATFLFFLVGTALFAFFKANPLLLDPSLKNDGVFPLFIASQLPAGISGLVIAAIFAAAMSSLDSSLNSISTVVVNDFYRRFRSPFSDAHGLRVARGLTLVFGVVGTGSALLMAGMDVQSLFSQYLRILGLTGGGLAGLLALGMFTRRGSGAGAIAGAIASAIVVYYVSAETDAHPFLFGMTGFISSFGLGYLASLVMPARTAK